MGGERGINELDVGRGQARAATATSETIDSTGEVRRGTARAGAAL
jgi:hypothetical protein